MKNCLKLLLTMKYKQWEKLIFFLQNAYFECFLLSKEFSDLLYQSNLIAGIICNIFDLVYRPKNKKRSKSR